MSIRTSKNLVFIRFLFGVLPIFVVPVIVMITIYFSSTSVTNKQTYERNLAVLQGSADNIERTFSNMDSIISYLDRDASINNFLISVNPLTDGSTTVDMLNTQNDLRLYTITNSIIKNIQLYSKRNQLVIDSTTNGLFLDRYYAYNYIQGMDMEAWQEKLLNARHKYDIYSNLTVVNSGLSGKNIIYAQSLPLSRTNDIGTVLFFLDEEYILSQFRKIPYQNSGFIYVLDEKGDVVISDNKSGIENPLIDTKQFTDQYGYFTHDINGRDMFVTYYRQEGKKWVFVAALPKSQVLAPTANIRLAISLLILFTIVSGVFLVLSSVSKLSKPISHIFALFAEKNKQLTYHDFEYEISSLVENSEKMKEALNSQIPEIKTSIFYNLLMGGAYRDTETIRRDLSKIHIRTDAKHYVVLIAAINELNANARLEEISAQKMYINSILTQCFEGIQGVYNLDFERTVLLLCFDDNELGTIFDTLERITREVVSTFSSHVQMSISFSGDITDDVSKIQSCFLNAYTAINYKQRSSGSTIQWYIEHMQAAKTNFYYPIEMESQIISWAGAGNAAKVTEVFQKLEKQNRHIMSNEFNPVFHNLLLSMNSTLIRMCNETENQNDILIQKSRGIAQKIERKEALQKTFYLLEDAFVSVAIHNKAEQGKDYNTQQAQILQYINEHYTDSQLSLTSVADTFHITEGYLSSLFKQISGENFSKYVEKLRMQRAQELMVRGFKISEVARMSGYNSPQVFGRAYRRNYSVAPTGNIHPGPDDGARNDTDT